MMAGFHGKFAVAAAPGMPFAGTGTALPATIVGRDGPKPPPAGEIAPKRKEML